jgi:hypothetical protein
MHSALGRVPVPAPLQWRERIHNTGVGVLLLLLRPKLT